MPLFSFILAFLCGISLLFLAFGAEFQQIFFIFIYFGIYIGAAPQTPQIFFVFLFYLYSLEIYWGCAPNPADSFYFFILFGHISFILGLCPKPPYSPAGWSIVDVCVGPGVMCTLRGCKLVVPGGVALSISHFFFILKNIHSFTGFLQENLGINNPAGLKL